MSRFVGIIVYLCVAFLCLLAFLSPPAFAAGAVEMQVEHILVQTIDEYNQAMEANDPAGWVRYFTDNVRRHSPVSDQQGKKDIEMVGIYELASSGRFESVSFYYDTAKAGKFLAENAAAAK